MQEKYYSPNSVEEKIYKDWEDQGAFTAPEELLQIIIVLLYPHQM